MSFEEHARKIVKRKGKAVECEECHAAIIDGDDVMVYDIPFKGPRGYPLRKYLHVGCWGTRQEKAKAATAARCRWLFENG